MKVSFKDESFAFGFVRNLGFMYYGGSDLGEMMATAGRITEGDLARMGMSMGGYLAARAARLSSIDF
jgi:hypothetical protein